MDKKLIHNIVENDQLINKLFDDINYVVDKAKNKVYSNIILESTKSFFLIGKIIVESEQSGQNRAGYGKSTLKILSLKLNSRYGKGYSVTNLQDYRKFYITWSKQRTLSVNSDNAFDLSFSHYLELNKLNDRQREFYEKISIDQGLTVRNLKRMIEVQTYERLGKSNISNSVKIINNNFDEIYKDPYILEFLNLPELVSGEESKLESAIINNLQKFLMELGKGFSFVGRQYRLTLEGDSYFADLVFYNIPLKCYVVLELKTTKATHSNIGQLQMYVNYFDRCIKDENDNKTIGILLCSSKNDKLVEFSLPKDNSQIYASKYELFLPNKKQLENIITEIE